jgi:c-di-AMP phosphodiesterase-like protein
MKTNNVENRIKDYYAISNKLPVKKIQEILNHLISLNVKMTAGVKNFSNGYFKDLPSDCISYEEHDNTLWFNSYSQDIIIKDYEWWMSIGKPNIIDNSNSCKNTRLDKQLEQL